MQRQPRRLQSNGCWSWVTPEVGSARTVGISSHERWTNSTVTWSSAEGLRIDPLSVAVILDSVVRSGEWTRTGSLEPDLRSDQSLHHVILSGEHEFCSSNIHNY